eukprot:GEMP01005987.1.p1 GENE.GEMP01005987.1~~GEMP01005987.1.p1  ORF type:complete len:1139 (+),score=305.32 GEMP01005987.1:61-3417(+)
MGGGSSSFLADLAEASRLPLKPPFDIFESLTYKCLMQFHNRVILDLAENSKAEEKVSLQMAQSIARSLSFPPRCGQKLCDAIHNFHTDDLATSPSSRLPSASPPKRSPSKDNTEADESVGAKWTKSESRKLLEEEKVTRMEVLLGIDGPRPRVPPMERKKKRRPRNDDFPVWQFFAVMMLHANINEYVKAEIAFTVWHTDRSGKLSLDDIYDFMRHVREGVSRIHPQFVDTIKTLRELSPDSMLAIKRWYMGLGATYVDTGGFMWKEAALALLDRDIKHIKGEHHHLADQTLARATSDTTIIHRTRGEQKSSPRIVSSTNIAASHGAIYKDTSVVRTKTLGSTRRRQVRERQLRRRCEHVRTFLPKNKDPTTSTTSLVVQAGPMARHTSVATTTTITSAAMPLARRRALSRMPSHLTILTRGSDLRFPSNAMCTDTKANNSSPQNGSRLVTASKEWGNLRSGGLPGRMASHKGTMEGEGGWNSQSMVPRHVKFHEGAPPIPGILSLRAPSSLSPRHQGPSSELTHPLTAHAHHHHHGAASCLRIDIRQLHGVAPPCASPTSSRRGSAQSQRPGPVVLQECAATAQTDGKALLHVLRGPSQSTALRKAMGGRQRLLSPHASIEDAGAGTWLSRVACFAALGKTMVPCAAVPAEQKDAAQHLQSKSAKQGDPPDRLPQAAPPTTMRPQMGLSAKETAVARAALRRKPQRQENSSDRTHVAQLSQTMPSPTRTKRFLQKMASNTVSGRRSQVGTKRLENYDVIAPFQLYAILQEQYRFNAHNFQQNAERVDTEICAQMLSGRMLVAEDVATSRTVYDKRDAVQAMLKRVHTNLEDCLLSEFHFGPFLVHVHDINDQEFDRELEKYEKFLRDHDKLGPLWQKLQIPSIYTYGDPLVLEMLKPQLPPYERDQLYEVFKRYATCDEHIDVQWLSRQQGWQGVDLLLYDLNGDALLQFDEFLGIVIPCEYRCDASVTFLMARKLDEVARSGATFDTLYTEDPMLATFPPHCEGLYRDLFHSFASPAGMIELRQLREAGVHILADMLERLPSQQSGCWTYGEFLFLVSPSNYKIRVKAASAARSRRPGFTQSVVEIAPRNLCITIDECRLNEEDSGECSSVEDSDE